MLKKIKATLHALIESKYSHFFFAYLIKSKSVDADIKRITRDNSEENVDFIARCCQEVDPGFNLCLIAENNNIELAERFKQIDSRQNLDKYTKRKCEEIQKKIY